MHRAFLTGLLAISAFLCGIAADHYSLIHATLSFLKIHPPRRSPPYLQPPGPQHAKERSQRLAYFRAVPGHADVVMLGDSMTEQGEWAELLPGVRVLNRGIRWDTSADLLERLDEVIFRKPKTVFLMIGVNDIRYGRSPEMVMENISKIVRRLDEVHIRTILQSAVQIAPQFNETTNSEVLALNSRLQAFARASGHIFLDINSLVTKDGALDPAFSADGMHLTPSTYLKWSAMVASTLADKG